MKTLLLPGLIVLVTVNARAQFSMHSVNYPSRLGEIRKVYADRTDPSVAGRLGTTGGPHHWDFSYPPAPDEEIRVVEIVSADAGSCSATFPGATYAERTLIQSSGEASWEYFSLDHDGGRLIHGLCAPGANPASPGAVFNPPTLQFTHCTFGSSWERGTSWSDTVDTAAGAFSVEVQFSSRATVDAFGTVALPNLGTLPALRVNETNTYVTSTLGIPLGTQYFHNYYWLVPGIGKAVEIVSKPGSNAPPGDYSVASVVLRAFEGSTPVTGLRIERTNTTLRLVWDAAGPSKSYVIVSSSAPTLRQRATASQYAAFQWEIWRTNTATVVSFDLPDYATNRFFKVGAIP